MERNAFINGRNIWSTWGAELMDGALEAILTPPPVKDYIENDSRLEHGVPAEFLISIFIQYLPCRPDWAL